MGFPLYVTYWFSLAAFNILSFCLVFVSLISMCLGVFLLGFILYGTLCASWTSLTISFSMLEKFSTIISSKIFLYPFFSSSGNPVIWKLVHLVWSQRSLWEGNGTALQYSCLENPMDGGAWWAAVHGVAKGRTRLSNFTFMHWRRKWQPTPVFLPGESQGRGILVGCCLWGCTESDTTEVT